jgi:hypothetical protein
MVKKIILLILIWTMIPAGLLLGEEKPSTWEPSPKERADRPWMPPGPDDVLIGKVSIALPLGRVLLARRGSEICAFKFIDTWLGETNYDHYTSYEFYYQGDGSRDFSKSNVLSGQGDLFFPRVRSFLGFGYQKGLRDTLECGGMKFEWLHIASINMGDAELAPTPWTSIKDVNVHDPRIQWYKKDKNRKKTIAHIDRLWGKPVGGEGK